MNKPPKEKPKTRMGSNSAYGELDVLKMRLLVALVCCIAIGVVAAIVVEVSYQPPPVTEFDAYERVYSECIAHETITHEQCHDIALEAIR